MKTQILKPLLILLLASTFFNGFSQEKNTQELTLGYGSVTTNEIQNFLSEFSLILVTVGTLTSDNQKYSGASYISYSYAIEDNFMIGLEAAYERITKNNFVGKTKIAEQTDNALSIGASARYSYISNPKFRMYSGLAAGYITVQAKSEPVKGSGYKAEKGNTGQFGYHLTGFGFRYGKKAAVVAELGFGYKGILNVGFNYRF
jgi:hypothetical protein